MFSDITHIVFPPKGSHLFAEDGIACLDEAARCAGRFRVSKVATPHLDSAFEKLVTYPRDISSTRKALKMYNQSDSILPGRPKERQK